MARPRCVKDVRSMRLVRTARVRATKAPKTGRARAGMAGISVARGPGYGSQMAHRHCLPQALHSPELFFAGPANQLLDISIRTTRAFASFPHRRSQAQAASDLSCGSCCSWPPHGSRPHLRFAGVMHAEQHLRQRKRFCGDVAGRKSCRLERHDRIARDAAAAEQSAPGAVRAALQLCAPAVRRAVLAEQQPAARFEDAADLVQRACGIGDRAQP